MSQSNLNDLVALLCKAAEAEQKENYPAAFLAYKHALLLSDLQEHQNLLCNALKRVGNNMTSSVKALDNYKIELSLRFKKNKTSYHFSSRLEIKQICDLVLPEFKPDTSLLLLDITQGYASTRLAEQGTELLSLVPVELLEQHLLFEYQVQKRERFRDHLYTNQKLLTFDKKTPIIEEFNFSYAIALISNKKIWQDIPNDNKRKLLTAIASQAKIGTIFVLPNTKADLALVEEISRHLAKANNQQINQIQYLLDNKWLYFSAGEIPQPSSIPLASLENISTNRIRFKVPLEKCRDLNGWAYTQDHYFVKTLMEYPQCSTYEGSTLEHYYTHFCPKNRQEQYGLKGNMGVLAQGWPLDPWRSVPANNLVRKNRYETRKGGNHLYGPNTKEFGQAEFKRLTSAYLSLEKNGYQPELYSDGFVTGYFLSNGKDYRFIVTEGQHRVPALAALGHKTLDIRINMSDWYPIKCVERALVANYDYVKKKVFTKKQALACFDHHFDGNFFVRLKEINRNDEMKTANKIENIRYLTKEDYFNLVEQPDFSYFKNNTPEKRWDYFSRVVDLIQQLGLEKGNSVLELGTMGMKCVLDSDTIDKSVHWKLPYTPTYEHNLLQLPWPIADKKYELLIALRVFMHLAPKQKECLLEAFRIAKKVIILVPTYYKTLSIENASGMSYNFIVEALGGIHPNLYAATKFGGLYYFDTENPSRINVEHFIKGNESNRSTTTNKPNLLSVLEKFSVKEIKIPSCIANSENGKLDPALLEKIRGGRLIKPAAKAWNRMRQAALNEGIVITPSSSFDTYRELNEQISTFKNNHFVTNTPDASTLMWEGKYWKLKPKAPQTAIPGTSSHGWGLSVLLYNRHVGKYTKAGQWLLKNAEKFGFCWEDPKQPWRLIYFAGDEPVAAEKAINKIAKAKDKQSVFYWNEKELEQAIEGKWLLKPKNTIRASRIITRDSVTLEASDIVLLNTVKRSRLGISVNALVKSQELPSAIITPLPVNEIPKQITQNNISILQIQDAKTALHHLGSHLRNNINGYIISITGSAGKSSTCNLLSAALRASGNSVEYYSGNVNATVDIPKNLLSMNYDSNFYVLEVSGGATYWSLMQERPDIAIVTNIGEAHLSMYKTKKNLALVKGALFKGIKDNGYVIICRDTEYFDLLYKLAQEELLNIITYGEHKESKIRLLDYVDSSGVAKISTPIGELSFALPVLGLHLVKNAMACIAVAIALGQDVQEMINGFANFEPEKGRGVYHQIPKESGYITLLDEAFNANPLSMRATIEASKQKFLSGDYKRYVLILGDMLEMGAEEIKLHKELAETLIKNKPDILLLCGSLMKYLANELPSTFDCEIYLFEDYKKTTEWAENNLLSGDFVMVKSSHGTGLNKLVEVIVNKS